MLQKSFYNGLVLPLTYTGICAASAFHGKLRRTIRGRRGIRDRWRAGMERAGFRPVWFHAASVGEYEQARPIISALHRDYPDIPVVVSVTSPSGYEYISAKEKIGADSAIRFADYLPFDFERNARFCIETIEPRLLVFVKFDLWPNLVWSAADHGTPVVLVDATLSETSRRNSGAGRRFYSSVYSRLNKILAISEADARRFLRCVPDHPRVAALGDTRFDRVMERRRDRRGPQPAFHKNGRPTIIAGSTWPKDEIHLLNALADVARAHPSVLLVIAPHEPSAERVEALLSWARAEGLVARTLSRHEKEAGDAERVVVVDSVGALAELYQYGDAAYVGGSYSTGVHNVIEPAVMGIPVIFGPVHENSFEALELLRHDAAIKVAGEKDIFRALDGWISDPASRTRMGANARRYVESQLGATERYLDEIREYL